MIGARARGADDDDAESKEHEEGDLLPLRGSDVAEHGHGQHDGVEIGERTQDAGDEVEGAGIGAVESVAGRPAEVVGAEPVGFYRRAGEEEREEHGEPGEGCEGYAEEDGVEPAAVVAAFYEAAVEEEDRDFSAGCAD